MNVVLNIPAEPGTGRTGASAPRAADANADGNNFGALFDEVARTTAPGRTARSDPSSGAADTPDDGEAGTAPRSAYQHSNGAPAARDAAQETTLANPDAAAGAGNGQAREGDAATVDANGAGQDDTAADPTAAETVDGKSASRGADTSAEKPGSRDSKRTDHKNDGQAKPTDSNTAGPSASVAAPSPAAASASGDHQNGTSTDSAHAGQTGKSVQDAAGKGNGASGPVGRNVPSGGAGQAADAPSASGTVRYWAQGDTAAALAAAARNDRQQQSGTPHKTTSNGGNKTADVRVTAYEQHAAPPAAPGARAAAATKAAATDGALAAAAAQPVKGTAQADGGAAKTPPVSAKDRAGKGNPPIGHDGASAAAKDLPGKQGAARQDPIVMPDATPSSGRDAKDGGQGRTADQGFSASLGDGQQKAQTVQGAAPSGKVISAGAPAPSSAPASPLVMPDATQSSGRDAKDGGQGRAAGQGFSASLGGGQQKAQTAQGAAPSGNVVSTGASAPASPLVAGVASGITGAINAARAAASQSASASPAVATGGVQVTPVHTITLNLDMANYGRIDLRISLKGQAVRVDLKAERAETAQALARDDASLRDALHHAGYEAQQIQIDKRDGTQPRLGDAGTSGQQQAGGAGTGASSGNAAGGQHAATQGERPQARPNANAFSLHDQDSQDVPRQDRTRSSDRLYV